MKVGTLRQIIREELRALMAKKLKEGGPGSGPQKGQKKKSPKMDQDTRSDLYAQDTYKGRIRPRGSGRLVSKKTFDKDPNFWADMEA